MKSSQYKKRKRYHESTQQTEPLRTSPRKKVITSNTIISSIKFNDPLLESSSPLDVCTSCRSINCIEPTSYEVWECHKCQYTVPDATRHTQLIETIKCINLSCRSASPFTTIHSVHKTTFQCNVCNATDTRERSDDDVARKQEYTLTTGLTEVEKMLRAIQNEEDKSDIRDQIISRRKAIDTGTMKEFNTKTSRTNKLIQKDTDTPEITFRRSITQATSFQIEKLISHFNSDVQQAHRGMSLPSDMFQQCIEFAVQFHVKQFKQKRSTSDHLMEAIFLHVAQRNGFPLHYKELTKRGYGKINTAMKRIKQFLMKQQIKPVDPVEDCMKQVRVWINMCRKSHDFETKQHRMHPVLDEQEMKIIYEQEDSLKQQLLNYKSDPVGAKLLDREPHVLAAAVISKACKFKRNKKLVTDNHMALIVDAAPTTVASCVMMLKEI